ncbi:hypothetical protein [Pseudomonas sp.]|uniref:hypothetical protein n=1 Tax=Pseudomonas sp. TaxID=306 RepID=UPI003D097C5F
MAIETIANFHGWPMGLSVDYGARLNRVIGMLAALFTVPEAPAGDVPVSFCS